MSHHPPYDVAVIGGGIVGTSTALSLVQRHSLSVCVFESENELALHQTGRNSGVIHSGLYYIPGSQKAATCTEGRELLYRYCERNGITADRCGKLVVAADSDEAGRLRQLYQRGLANGLSGIVMMNRMRFANANRMSRVLRDCSSPKPASFIIPMWSNPLRGKSAAPGVSSALAPVSSAL